jgi:hypothetical protein
MQLSVYSIKDYPEFLNTATDISLNYTDREGKYPSANYVCSYSLHHFTFNVPHCIKEPG